MAILLAKAMNTKVFKDQALNEQFWKQGYLKVPFLNKVQLHSLRSLHQDLRPDHRYNTQDARVSYHFSFLDPNRAYKEAVFKGVQGIVAASMETHLNAYEPLIVNFVQKEPGKGEVPVHQNWNFVDEQSFCSISIWCPLVDVHAHCGALEMIPGTHRMFRNVLRSPSIPWFFRRYDQVLIDEYLEVVPVMAGEALIFDDSIIHYSKPNQGDYDRTVVQVIAVPKAAQPKHYYQKKRLLGSAFYELDVDSDFFLDFHFDITKKPDGARRTRKIDYRHPRINEQRFREKLAEEALS